MKKSELRQLIKEEIIKEVSEKTLRSLGRETGKKNADPSNKIEQFLLGVRDAFNGAEMSNANMKRAISTIQNMAKKLESFRKREVGHSEKNYDLKFR